VLQALGVPVSAVGDAPAALASERVRRWEEVVPPCAVALDGAPARLALTLPSDADGDYHVELAIEGGEVRRLGGRIRDLGAAGPVVDIGGRRKIVRTLELPVLEPGYHSAHVDIGGGRWPCLVIAAPSLAYGAPGKAPRRWGVFAPTYALRSQTTRGAGDLGDLGELADWVSAQGGAIVGTLPLLAAFLDEPFEPSPYSPVSRLFWNELFVDLDRLAGEYACPQGRAALEGVAAGAKALAAEPLVDYRGQAALVRSVLGAFAGWAWEQDAIRAELEAFAARPRVDDYAQFRAAVERYRTGWQAWPAGPRDGALRARDDYDEDARRYHVFAQLVLSRQLAEFKRRSDRAGLYLDLPVGVNGAGYDVWRDRDAFVPGCEVGAPPDELFLGGQNWCLPPLHPRAMRRLGYRYFIDCARAQMEHASMLRIDHVMGLHRLYWIPKGGGATDGVYVRYPARELYAILSLESHRQRCALVGEDLGTVPDEVPPAMERHGLHRLYVAQFALPEVEGEAPSPPSATAVASLGTHDTPSFAGFWRGQDIDEKVSLGLVDEPAAALDRLARRRVRRATRGFLRARGYDRACDAFGVMRGLSAYLAASAAQLALVTLEDLWLETEPQNVPGTAYERPNWRRRLRLRLDEIRTDPRVSETIAAFNGRARDRRPGS
jgi:4-alpha-glucanotransferase